MKTSTYRSPIGRLRIGSDDSGALTAIDFNKSGASNQTPSPISKALDSYFSSANDLKSLPVKLDLTEFEMKVLSVIRKIPPGQTRTYQWVAAKAGSPQAARAVGNALAKNPIPIVIPCHRVVAANGLGGYSGGLDRKRFLLAHES